jgi:hypothetical protein
LLIRLEALGLRILDSPMAQKAERTFVAASLPLVLAAYFSGGSIDQALLLSAGAAGVRAVLHSIPQAKGF